MSPRLSALLVALAVALPWSPPAHAAAVGVFTMAGTGTFSPGLDTLPAAQTISMTAAASFTGTDGSSAATCSFSGLEIAGHLAAGVGTASGGCGLHRCNLWASVRTAGLWAWVCAGTPATTMHCVWTPSNTLPTTAFAFTCEGVYGVAP